MVEFTIDGLSVKAEKGETILEVARRYDIYIPTMCYISKTSPCASCRICSVEVEGVDGFILSCDTKPTNGIKVITNSNKLEQERKNIVKLYDVNHPLECGVCDKSGECDLQNITLEFAVDQQTFSAKDQLRKVKDWGLISYDPSLCILCEKCVHVCNEVIGDDAIEIQFGGYKSTIIPKYAETLECTFCGECIAVCPVGALVSTNFKYQANAWELKKIPATCVHCSAGCPLEYEVKHADHSAKYNRIYRVKNNFEFSNLCGAGRFGYDFGRKDISLQTDKSFQDAVEALKNADAIKFNSMITNEEALILQKLKEKLGIKIFNEEARLFNLFMKNFSSVSGKSFYEASVEDISNADAIITIGTQVTTDNPAVRYAMTVAAKQNGAKVSCFYPFEDYLLQNIVTQYVKMEAGTEEGVIALLLQEVLKDLSLPQDVQSYLDALDDGYLEAETNVGEEELNFMSYHFRRAKKRVMVVGTDLFSHPQASNIAKLLGLIQKYSQYKVFIVPKEINTLGVSCICDLDQEEQVENLVGYNEVGDFTISAIHEDADMFIPALNQQEGTFTTMDKRVVPTNVALKFNGKSLNDLASSFGIIKDYTIDYTKELVQINGYKNLDFDSLENFFSKDGKDIRGYKLENSDITVNYTLEDVSELPEYNGTVICHANPVLQFNKMTAQSTELPKDLALKGSKQFAIAAKIQDGDEVIIDLGDIRIKREFKIDQKLKGTIAINPTFDLNLSANRYRFEKSKIERV